MSEETQTSPEEKPEKQPPVDPFGNLPDGGGKTYVRNTTPGAIAEFPACLDRERHVILSGEVGIIDSTRVEALKGQIEPATRADYEKQEAEKKEAKANLLASRR